MKRIKPRALGKGGVIGICAPASPPVHASDLREGVGYLEGLGFRVEPGRNLYRRDGYLAGTDRERAADINALFKNPRVDAIFTLRGGYGSARLLPLIDFDAVRKHPKIFVGYSDITALQMAIHTKCALVTFAGPMVAGAMSHGLSGYAEELFWALLSERRPIGRVRSAGLFRLRAGTTRGTLLGGNLSMLCHLAGTPYLPPMKNSVVFLEDIGERPYRIDRMLYHLKLAGFFRGVRGIVLGKFANCVAEKGKPSLSLGRVFDDTLGDLGLPVLGGFQHGHVRGSLTIPIGIRAEIRSGRGMRGGHVMFAEAAVS